MKPRGFARRWASVTNPLVLVATGLKSGQVVGLPTMSFISREKRKDRRANNSFKPTPFRCVACVRSLRSHASPHRSRRGLTQALGCSADYPCLSLKAWAHAIGNVPLAFQKRSNRLNSNRSATKAVRRMRPSELDRKRSSLLWGSCFKALLLPRIWQGRSCIARWTGYNVISA